ncbi:hypothetical protein GCM10011588_01670 [Nocardia jinanensis]|uniref:Uncharacterized protein n=1 Tax=Nocardia jinanensis TaxID=382504 RepID=A0A917R615_9NOCA|nr:hypothetical protein GCM10011588_01670 [Nocardia jinanensis]
MPVRAVQPGDEVGAGGFAEIGHHHRGVLGGEAAHDIDTYPTGRPGHQYDLVPESGRSRCHCGPFCSGAGGGTVAPHSLFNTFRPPTSIATATPAVVTAVISSAMAATSG